MNSKCSINSDWKWHTWEVIIRYLSSQFIDRRWGSVSQVVSSNINPATFLSVAWHFPRSGDQNFHHFLLLPPRSRSPLIYRTSITRAAKQSPNTWVRNQSAPTSSRRGARRFRRSSFLATGRCTKEKERGANVVRAFRAVLKCSFLCWHPGPHTDRKRKCTEVVYKTQRRYSRWTLNGIMTVVSHSANEEEISYTHLHTHTHLRLAFNWTIWYPNHRNHIFLLSRTHTHTHSHWHTQK